MERVKICGGGGGGRPNLACKLRDPSKLPEALETARTQIAFSLELSLEIM